MKPTAADKRDGLKPKYIVRHADGTPTARTAKYFVLRLDYHRGCDPRHIAACRIAVAEYAYHIDDHLPALAADLARLLRATARKS